MSVGSATVYPRVINLSVRSKTGNFPVHIAARDETLCGWGCIVGGKCGGMFTEKRLERPEDGKGFKRCQECLDVVRDSTVYRGDPWTPADIPFYGGYTKSHKDGGKSILIKCKKCGKKLTFDLPDVSEETTVQIPNLRCTCTQE